MSDQSSISLTAARAPNWWEKIKERLRVLRPTWLATVMVVALSLALQHPQAVDALHAIANADFFSAENLGFLGALLILAIASWYFPRALLYVRYSYTPDEQIGNQPPRYERWRRWMPRVLGALPIASAAMAFGRGGAWLFAGAYLLVALVFGAFVILRRKLVSRYEKIIYLHDEMPPVTFVIVIVFLLMAVILLAVFLASKVSAPQLVGPLGIVLLAAAGWIAFSSVVLIYPTHHYRLPSLLLILMMFTALFSLWNDNHQIRTLADAQAGFSRQPTTAHFSQWLDYRSAAIEAQTGYPVFIVAAEGGGIRAAYWTAAVLGALQNAEPGFACHVFAISGISGGSLGAAVFAAQVADAVEDSRIRCDGPPAGNSGEFGRAHLDFLGEDFLSPALAGMLYPDVVQRFLPLAGRFALPDRAAFLEAALEQEWPAQESVHSDRFADNFLALWASEQTANSVPALFLNGTWVEDGSRVVTSNLRPDSARFVKLDDMLDELQRDVSLATAVHLSARFTYVSPAGTVATKSGTRHVVDGGYFENSGALTATEIYESLFDYCSANDQCHGKVRFVALIISNNPTSANALWNSGPVGADDAISECTQPAAHAAASDAARDDPSGPQALRETLSPVWTLFQTRAARGLHAEERLRAAIGPCSTIRFQLRDISDLKIPLGWVLSHDSQANIASQADAAPGMNSVCRLVSGSDCP